MGFEEVIDTFVYLASHPFEPLDSNCENFRNIERLINQPDKEGTVLSKERHDGKDATDAKCLPTTHEEGCLPSFYLGYKYQSTADDSFPSRLWLGTSGQCVEPTLANCSRAF